MIEQNDEHHHVVDKTGKIAKNFNDNLISGSILYEIAIKKGHYNCEKEY